MNEFKQELSQLLMRYVSNNIITVQNNRSVVLMPLSNQQILDATHETLRVTLNINLQNVDSAALKTPANEFVITTPNAPDVLRMDYRRKDVMQTEFDNKDNSDRISMKLYQQKHTDQSINNNHENDKDETDIANRTLQGNDTTKDIVTGAQENLDQTFEKEVPPTDSTWNCKMYSMVDDTYKEFLDAMHKFENLKEFLLTGIRPIRRLSAIESLTVPKYQQHNHQHIVSMTNHRVKALRRSIQQMNDQVPVTPTSSHASSRNSLTVPSQSLSRRKSFGGSLASIPSNTSKPAIIVSSPLNQQNRSCSTGLLSELNKTTTLNPPSKIKMPVRNPKYAHIQSTIPKPVHLPFKRRVE